MAGGPLLPSSVYLGGAAGLLFPNPYMGGGGNAANVEQGIGVAASLGTNAVAQLRFLMPPAIPSGTLKLYHRGLANATSGAASITPSTASIAPGGDPSAAPLYAETTQTITWVASAANTQYVVTSITLGASGGTGYTVGDTITCAGGTFATACILRVSAVTAGVVTAFQILQQGVYSVKPTLGALTQGSTSGGGSGALATATFDSVGSADHYMEAKQALTPAPVVDGVFVVAYQFNTSGWTLAAGSTWSPYLLWE